MDDVLIQTSQAGDIDKLYEFITNDAAVLKRIDEIMFEDTPLHVAALAGQTCFAMEVMNLMPSFARKLNKDGLSPMHLALSKGHSELVLLLLGADQELVRVKGRGGITPLHYATQIGKIHLLAIFLAACPKSIEDVTVQSETAFHIAVKNNRLEALEVLVGWLQRVCHEDAFRWNTNIPNWWDKKGDTVLDIAVSNMQIEAIQLLAEINAKNSKELTALGTLQRLTNMSGRAILQMLRKRNTLISKASSPESTKTLANYLRSNPKFDENTAVFFRRLRMKISKDVRSALLVVAGVIVAATFQAVSSPPGSVRQENGNTIILSNGTFINTTISNATANGGSPSNDAGKRIISFFAYYGTNFLVLVSVICIISLLLPGGGFLALPLILFLLPALECYMPSTSADYITGSWVIPLTFFCLFLLIIQVCDRKGTKKIQQICYNAVKCPKEAVAEEVEESGARTTSTESGAQTVTSP